MAKRPDPETFRERPIPWPFRWALYAVALVMAAYIVFQVVSVVMGAR